ncbi:class I adenylate-forming enzyme family protein [Myceligenerans crystallogenes]|uniref:AMP-binding protein n=1 Tax=Myceligenerans crystallogenes TaxID=316335 RepID=A0ABN2N6K9_9MICO
MTPPKNIGVLYDWQAERGHRTVVHADRPADIAPGLGTSFDAAALATLVADTSAWLAAAGVERGSRVGIVKENHLDIQLLAAATARIGGLPATISALNRPDDIAIMLGKLEPAVVVIGTGALEKISRVENYPLAHVPHVVLGADPIPATSVRTARIADFSGAATPAVNLRPDDEPMMVTHTSGTTSTPKLVVHTADTNRAGTRVELLPIPGGVSNHRDTVLTSISFAHSRAYPFMIAQFRWAPANIVMVGDHSAAVAERMFERHRPTTVEATPNVYQHWVPIVRRRPELFGQVRMYINTFDTMHSSIARPFVEASRNPALMWGHSWGQSEVGPIALGIYTKRSLRPGAQGTGTHMNRLGIPWPGIAKVKVVDPVTMREQPRGTPGILMVKATSVCVDYLGDTDRWQDKRDGDWWNTGDYGTKDLLGRIHFLDRGVDRIEHSSAIEIETTLLERIPDAEEVVVLANGDDAPLAVVAMRDGTAFDRDHWTEITRDLPALAEPVVMPWADLPRTSTWKIRRNELRELLGENKVLAAHALDQRFI